MADLHNQDLVSTIEDTQRFAFGRPNQPGAFNIRWVDLLAFIGANVTGFIGTSGNTSIGPITLDLLTNGGRIFLDKIDSTTIDSNPQNLFSITTNNGVLVNTKFHSFEFNERFFSNVLKASQNHFAKIEIVTESTTDPDEAYVTIGWGTTSSMNADGDTVIRIDSASARFLSDQTAKIESDERALLERNWIDTKVNPIDITGLALTQNEVFTASAGVITISGNDYTLAVGQGASIAVSAPISNAFTVSFSGQGWSGNGRSDGKVIESPLIPSEGTKYFYFFRFNDGIHISFGAIDVVIPGITWSIQSSATNNSWNSVTHGNDLFVAVSRTGSGNRVMTSPDGIAWTSRTSAANNLWRSVVFGNGLYVAVSSSGTGNRVMTSPDGITWTIRTSAGDNSWNSVAYGNNLFVAVSLDGNVMTSPDGITWTLRTAATNNSWTSVAYGNGIFVAVSNTGTGDRVMTSTDGITWTSRSSASDNSWRSVVYGNGIFVAVSNDGVDNRVMTSPDGIAWTIRTSAADNNWTSITFGNNLFVAVSNTGTGNRVMTSFDGINWVLRTSATDNNWTSVVPGKGIFVAVSDSGTGNRVMTSA